MASAKKRLQWDVSAAKLRRLGYGSADRIVGPLLGADDPLLFEQKVGGRAIQHLVCFDGYLKGRQKGFAVLNSYKVLHHGSLIY